MGVIGCGAIARRQHIPAFVQAGAAVTAFASRTEMSAQAAADEAGGGAVCADWRELLARDDVDAVTICTPNASHAEHALAAIEAGKHVLVEKPFTVTVAEADQVIAAARARDVFVMTAHSMRFAAPVVAMRKALQDMAIGTVTSVEATMCHAGPAAWAPEAVWFLDRTRAGGGALLDLGVHLVDTLRFLLDDEFTHVTALLDGEPVEQDAFVMFGTAGGVKGTLHAGWRSSAGMRIVLALTGTTGSLVFDDRGLRLHRPTVESQQLPLDAPGDSPQAAFLRAIAAGRAVSPNAEDGRAAVCVVQASYLAAAEGRTTRVG